MNIVKETDTLVAKSKTNLNKYWKGQSIVTGKQIGRAQV